MTVCHCLIGTQGKQRTTTTRVGEQDSPLTSKHLATTLLSDERLLNLAKIKPFTLVKAYSLLLLFDLRFLEWSHVLSNLV